MFAHDGVEFKQNKLGHSESKSPSHCDKNLSLCFIRERIDLPPLCSLVLE